MSTFAVFNPRNQNIGEGTTAEEALAKARQSIYVPTQVKIVEYHVESSDSSCVWIYPE